MNDDELLLAVFDALEEEQRQYHLNRSGGIFFNKYLELLIEFINIANTLTEEDIFYMMQKKNPSLELLVKEFNLELDI